MSLFERGRTDGAPFAERLPTQLISSEGGSEQGIVSGVPERRVYTIQDSLYTGTNHSHHLLHNAPHYL